MVHDFYDKVRGDEVLGPIFNRHVADWGTHLPTMVNFWSSALRGTARFRGAPMPKHAALPGLSVELFASHAPPSIGASLFCTYLIH